jgi:ribosomal protein S18 acetylase RimI-like enzyme
VLGVVEINLEAASRDDVEEILRLRQQVARWLSNHDIDLWQSALPPERLVAWIQQNEVLVQRDRGRIIGAVALLDRDPDLWGDDTTPATYVHALMVDRSYAGENLGGRMLERVEGMARARGARYVRLDAGADLDRLQRWYDARGYQRVATRTLAEMGETFEVTLRQKPLMPSLAELDR